jgi:hypothetical protein
MIEEEELHLNQFVTRTAQKQTQSSLTPWALVVSIGAAVTKHTLILTVFSNKKSNDDRNW